MDPRGKPTDVRARAADGSTSRSPLQPQNCPICMDPVDRDAAAGRPCDAEAAAAVSDQTPVVLSCKHQMHAGCMQGLRDTVCPVCRSEMTNLSSEFLAMLRQRKQDDALEREQEDFRDLAELFPFLNLAAPVDPLVALFRAALATQFLPTGTLPEAGAQSGFAPDALFQSAAFFQSPVPPPRVSPAQSFADSFGEMMELFRPRSRADALQNVAALVNMQRRGTHLSPVFFTEVPQFSVLGNAGACPVHALARACGGAPCPLHGPH